MRWELFFWIHPVQVTVFELDEENEGEISVGEKSEAERELTPDIPEAPSVQTGDSGEFTKLGDVDSETLTAFLVAVIYAHIAVLFVFLGPMLWYFEGLTVVGPAVFVAGVLAGVRTYQTYRRWDRS